MVRTQKRTIPQDGSTPPQYRPVYVATVNSGHYFWVCFEGRLELWLRHGGRAGSSQGMYRPVCSLTLSTSNVAIINSHPLTIKL